jgi:2-C-methyl-D-erythritol 4-phosphate cytidylyltransferase
MSKYTAVIPCAGSGIRFGGQLPKQYVKVDGQTILERTLIPFIQCQLIAQIVLVVAKDDAVIDTIISKLNISKIIVLKVGGETRAQTVTNAINLLELAELDWVLIHDAVRCFITEDLITRLINQLSNDLVGGILAIPATDTVKQVSNGVVQTTLNRNDIYLAQTPQMFRAGILKAALNQANLARVTDEASAVEQLGKSVKIVLGEATNIKITYPQDLTKL